MLADKTLGGSFMGAFVEHDFDKSFLLDEERLRKILHIFNERNLDIEFKVYRGDSYWYVTENIEDVLSEDNDDWKKIERLEILSKEGTDITFKQIFSVENGVSIRIEGDNRDTIFLLFTDLREYIKNDVAKCINITKDFSRNFSMIVLFLLMLGMMGSQFIREKSQLTSAESILNSTEIVEKLNFLVQDRLSNNPKGMLGWTMGMIVMMLIMITNLLNNLVNYFFPRNVFIFGKQKQLYENKRQFVGKIFWGIAIAFIVSILAGLIVWKMTNS